MKIFQFLIPLLVILSMKLSVTAQNQSDEVFVQIEGAIKKGNASQLSAFFNSIVEVSILEKDQSYSQTQAQFVMKEFFEKYPVRSFSILHKGSSGQNIYAVGSYISTNGTFDVNIFIKKYGDQFKIDQIRFEVDK